VKGEVHLYSTVYDAVHQTALATDQAHIHELCPAVI